MANDCATTTAISQRLPKWRYADVRNKGTDFIMPTTPSKAAHTAAVTVLLTNEQLAQLDEVSAVIRRNSGCSLDTSIDSPR